MKEGYHDIVSTRGLEPDKLTETPYNFSQETIAKIFYIQAASLAHLGGTDCLSSYNPWETPSEDRVALHKSTR